MQRRSTRISAPGTHKRVASALESISATSSKKSRISNASPTKSKYFSEPVDEFEQAEQDSPSDTNDDASDFEGTHDESELSEADEDDASDSDHTPASKGRSANSKGTSKASEVWRPGVKTGEWCYTQDIQGCTSGWSILY